MKKRLFRVHMGQTKKTQPELINTATTARPLQSLGKWLMNSHPLERVACMRARGAVCSPEQGAVVSVIAVAAAGDDVG